MTNTEKFEYLKRFRGTYLNYVLLRDKYLELRDKWIDPSAETAHIGNVGGVSGEQNKLESSYICLVQMQENMYKAQDRYLDMLIKIEIAIEKLDDETLKSLLRLRYIHCIPWKDVAVRLSYDVSHVFRLHNEAVNVLEI
jgi:hypothetical protein